MGADRALDADQVEGQLDCFDFVPLCLHLKGFNLVLILIYWTFSLGFTGENLQKVSSLLAFTQCLSDRWIAIGDLNVSRAPWPPRLGSRTWAYRYSCLQILMLGPRARDRLCLCATSRHCLC